MSPNSKYIAFAARTENQIGTVNIATKQITWYGSGTPGNQGGPKETAEFVNPNSVSWSLDGLTLVVNELGGLGFSGLRFVDFATGFVSSSANNLMSDDDGRGVQVLDATGLTIFSWDHGVRVTVVPGAANDPVLEAVDNFDEMTDEEQDQFLSQIGASRHESTSTQNMKQHWCNF